MSGTIKRSHSAKTTALHEQQRLAIQPFTSPLTAHPLPHPCPPPPRDDEMQCLPQCQPPNLMPIIDGRAHTTAVPRVSGIHLLRCGIYTRERKILFDNGEMEQVCAWVYARLLPKENTPPPEAKKELLHLKLASNFRPLQ